MILNTLLAYCHQIARIRATRQATEHSYRPAFAALIETVGGSRVQALNEPSHIACGAPDFIVERSGVPMGHVECKDVSVNLDDVENDAQLRRYRDGLPNLMLTNYLECRWYTEGQRRDMARLGRFDYQNRIEFDRAGAEQVGALFDAFFATDLPTINTPRELAARIAAKARLLRNGVERIFTQEDPSGPLHDLLTAYQHVLIQNLNPAAFADLQAQTAAYGLFAARCQHEPSKPFTRKEAIFAKTTPFLRDVFGRIAGPDIDPRIAWIVDDLARLLDRADMAAILTDFGRRTRQEDPVVHFYEDFLAAYDPKLREVRGVYYTPEPVVSYIVRSVDHLLRDRFGLADGLADTATVTVERPDGERETIPRVLILDPAAGTGTFLREAAGADDVKRKKPVMVVLGNPPYSGHSANKGAWIAELIDDYKRGFPELSKPAQAKWLSDDYVKFIRFAQWRIERTGEGVLGFVTNHGWLDNPTFRGMRHSLMETFDEIHVLDLHGNAKKKERTPDGGRDDNVFDIQQGVAIGLFVKRSDTADKPGKVFHADVWGERESGADGGKYGWLAANGIETTEWTELAPKPPLYLFVPRDEELLGEYEAAWSIAAIFSPNGDPAPGIVTTHDQFAISWTPEEAAAKVERLLATTSEDEARSQWRLCSQNQWQYGRAKRELADGAWRERIEPILYRPFDIRTTVFDGNVAVHRRERVMRHMLAGSNLGLATTWEHVFISRNLIQHHTVSLKEVNYLFPLYIHPLESSKPEDNPFHRDPNINQDFIKILSATVGLDFIPDGTGNLETTFGPEDIFYYVYAILHSPEYRRRYADFLKSDFPRIPLTNDRELFTELITLGKQLAALHLMETEGTNTPTFPVIGSNRMEKVRYTPPNNGLPGRVWINRAQYFEGVTPAAWTFTIGGYRPAEKWLKDRKGRVLSFNDITHYRTICAALAETPDLMARIDETIAAHGSWPLTC
jgi:hypothetical protein